ncbi:MAG TPA: glutamate--tRNA ligase [candidate division Zixibacteria bacterium]|nr:glutamate--tRNA ligase [candidate division Zixibacteria bacterium]
MNTDDKKRKVRVRIAPSPSGYVHVGTARTAIFNYLFARHHGGDFLVRIENTDETRSSQEFVDGILEAMKWLGLTWDEDIIYQSDRADLYAEHAQKILESGYGYRCFCTPEQLQADRDEAKANKSSMLYNRRCLKLSREEVDRKLADGVPHTIRIRIPDGELEFDDLVSGHLTRSSNDVEDFIIARSDGSATYNLAVVVDDHLMDISHVIRGNDHVTNTFKQIQIYKALGWDVPQFAHVPLILRPDKKKVSKRLGDKDVVAYREEGVLPEAMLNYLCLLGWSPKTDREIYSRDELIELFNAENFNSSNAIFDEEKLLAFNQEYIAHAGEHELAVIAAPMLVDAGFTTKYWLETRWEYLRQVIGLFKPRMKKVSDLIDQCDYFFSGDFQYDPETVAKRFTPEAAGWLTELADRFEKLTRFVPEELERVLDELAEELGQKRAALIHPTRLAVSGRPHGPGLFEMLTVLSQSVVIDRMRKAADYIRHNNK